MRTASLRLFIAIVLCCTSTVVFAADSGFVPPTSVYMHTDFDEADSPFSPHPWEPATGAWLASGGSYNSITSVMTALTTMAEYSPNPNGPPTAEVEDALFGFQYRARVLNRGTATDQLAGLVYNYIDAANYYEVIFSSHGTATVRRVLDGTVSIVTSSPCQAAEPGVWFDVEVARRAGITDVLVNGIPVIQSLVQDELSGGRLGLITHGTTAKFDKVSIARPFGLQPFREDFSSGPTQLWNASSLDWEVANGTFNSTAVVPTSMTLAMGGNAAQAEETLEYSFRARMLNPFRGSGNLIGIYFHESTQPPNEERIWGEVVFSPTGVAALNLYYDGAKHTLATAHYGGQQNQWFDVRLDASLGMVSVAVDGVALFRDVSTAPLISGNVGLITHWAPGRFDDVWYDNTSMFYPLSTNFDDLLPDQWLLSGMWNNVGGTLNSGSADASELLVTACACWKTDIALRARLLNQYGASGNLVGLVYNYQRLPFARGDQRPYVGLYTGDYYEVVFSPTGTADMNKVINGTRYRVASATHAIPRNVWFDVEVLRKGVNTTVKVNGSILFDKVPQAELGHGDVGIVTHWAKGRFDDLSVRDAPGRRSAPLR
jgi:hypothetical protein